MNVDSVSKVECPTCQREEANVVRVQKSLRGQLILTYRCKKKHNFDVVIPAETDCDIRVRGI